MCVHRTTSRLYGQSSTKVSSSELTLTAIPLSKSFIQSTVFVNSPTLLSNPMQNTTQTIRAYGERIAGAIKTEQQNKTGEGDAQRGGQSELERALLAAIMDLRRAWIAPHRFNLRSAEGHLVELSERYDQPANKKI